MDISLILQNEFGIKKEFVDNIISLIDDYNTIYSALQKGNARQLR